MKRERGRARIAEACRFADVGLSGCPELKVAGSIVTISAIHLLRTFMNARTVPEREPIRFVIVRLLRRLGRAAGADGPADRERASSRG